MISLALAPPSGIFYGTEEGFGYVTEAGNGFAFVQGVGGELRVHGEDLYLFIAEEGVVKSSPVSSFEQLAQSLMAAAASAAAAAPAEPLELNLTPETAEETPRGAGSAKERLVELEELLRLELITEAEFAEKRQQILDDL